MSVKIISIGALAPTAGGSAANAGLRIMLNFACNCAMRRPCAWIPNNACT
jgi:hypothetical protein